ncbi:MAG: SDR family oxidoreductase [Flavobacteriales bacterium]|nr:SDR family oxidoreductase [Flavobacteriales bacterium]
MKEKLLSAFGFPPPAILNRVNAPYTETMGLRDDNMLLVDARHVKDEEGLKAVYGQLKDGATSVRPTGKVVLIALDPKAVTEVRTKSFQRAIEGVMRSLAKELGGKGSTVNLLRVPGDAALEQLALPLHFFGSGRSAFITGQALTVGPTLAAGDLKDKVCVVTGGAGGIGSATVKRLEAEGCKVIIADMPQMAEKAKALESANVKFFAGDLTKEQDADALLAFIKEIYGRLDVLVNNAGITRDKTLKNMPEHFWDQVIAINLTAVMQLTEKALVKGLLPDRGRIINTSSISGIAGNFGQTNYTATKAALIAFGEGLGADLKERGITVNAIAPGFIATDMVKTMPFMTRLFAERLTSLAQAGKPTDIAEAVAFLAHPAAQGITGQVLRVCGGSFLGA